MHWFNQHIHWYWSYYITGRRNAIGHCILTIDALSLVNLHVLIHQLQQYNWSHYIIGLLIT